MKATTGHALKATAWAGVIVWASISPAFGQYAGSVGDLYGVGAEGTIGRGTNILPWGPSDPRSRGGRFASGAPTGWYRAPAVTPGNSRVPGVSRPYPTGRLYAPGDGYGYPLYYDRSTGSYFYYPVRR